MDSTRTTGELLQQLNLAFRPSAPVHRQELLAGRVEQLFDLQEMARTPGASAAIFGERGVGKSSVAAVFGSNLDASGDYNTIRINCSTSDTFSSLCRAVRDELLDRDHELVSISAAQIDAFSQHDAVRMLRHATGSKGLVTIFDEFDVIADACTGGDFANLMKAISDQNINAHIVVVGVAEDVDTILEGHASVGRNLHQILMPRLNDMEIQTIVIHGLGIVDLAIGDSMLTRVARLSQGLPHYAHLLGKCLGRRAILDGRTKIACDHWRSALEEALTQSEQAITDLYSEAVTTAKPSMLPKLLLACALAEKDEKGYFRPIDAGRNLERLEGRSFEMASYTGNLANLTKPERGPALQSREFGDRRKRYRFANPLLQPYTLMRAVRDGHIDDKMLVSGPV